MEKGQKCQLQIDDMSNEGQGIGRAEGMAVFVKGAMPGDTVIAEITKVKKNYAFAVTTEIIEPSPYRIEMECPYAGDCGGCTYAGMNYEGQLAVKERQVREKLIRLGGLEHPKLNPIVGMDKPYAYRNKAQMPISTGGIITRKGGIIENLGKCTIGFYKAKSHDVVNCTQCLLQAPPVTAVAEVLRQFMKSDNITAYDPKWEKGLMRHLVVKTAMGTGEVMAILVINGKGIPNSSKLIEMMDEAVGNLPVQENGIEYSLESVVININKGKTSEIMGKECLTIAGKPTILERVGDMEFEISPLAFYQVNPVQMEVLYNKVLEYAQLKGHERILDLYCGVGTIGLFCAEAMRKAGKDADTGNTGQVLGIESVKGAVLDANRNAVINGLVNAQFLCGRAEEELPKVLAGYVDKEGFEIPPFQPDLIILDPPRAGCAPELLEATAAAAPDKVIYVSCDPATLARDVKILGKLGYKFVEGTPVDMFPWTRCVETCVLLSHKNPQTSPPSL
ncbi:23S rRNA (uracil(1939)-C(5))-methyltransferase RlmD [Aminipila luticellarii]|uniref:23S rRNA (Uracil(1939)-C(5))-methyltransferase RlmD n=1 Tax=Aminipila luticellarii TaxID=2507160 RepID=A0A410PTG1_9FIRM|nr:23S rRNA (uracil(1939)-C(5))-methyltransferase RlmD [Aminipila luticellarii]QAT42203.1 23S rRNA (uracil(1939)-C(5))-methyltransferase RlmD [Aminipila luticellarii]